MTKRTVKPLRLSLGENSDDQFEENTAQGQLRQNQQQQFQQNQQQSQQQYGGKQVVNLDRLRAIVRASLSKNLFENAIFFANKLVTLSGAQPKDVHLLAQSYYLGKQYRRAVHLIQQHGYLTTSQQENQPVFGDDEENRNEGRRPSSTKSGRRSTRSVGSTRRVSLEQQRAEERNAVDNTGFVLLAVQCLIQSGQHEEAQSALESFLGEADIETLRHRARQSGNSFNYFDSSEGLALGPGTVNPIASLCLLRGRVYETLDNRIRAAAWYKAALFCDIYCYEAFDALIDNQLRPSEERHLMNELKRIGAFEGEAAWLQAVYASRLSKHDYREPLEPRFEALDNIVGAPSRNSSQGTTSYVDTSKSNLGQDLDCATDKAEALYQQHDAQGAYQVTRRIRKRDPYHLRCITVHLASLVELKRKSELFHTAHHLVDAYPSHPVAWFAVGCYYYCIGKYDPARRFFNKATNMDSSMAVAWIGFGHSFAMQEESDQAMAAYRTASRLFIGSHLPVLCTAIEYLRTNNVVLAEQFCRQAKAMCATDPLVLNELGVIHYRQQRYHQAVDCFLEALNLCSNQPERLRYAWEASMFNLGHSYRKLGRYDEAIHYYEMSLSYCPKEASAYSALGLTYHLQGKLEQAIQNYHNALGLKPEDTFSSEMLDKALTESYNKPLNIELPNTSSTPMNM